MTAPVISPPTMGAEAWRATTMLCYPAVLLVAFIVSAATYSIKTSRSEEDLQTTVTGPGGKPLPVKRRRRDSHAVFAFRIGTWARRLFQVITTAVVLTFVADAAATVNHVLEDRPDRWWCGEERVVYVVGGFFFHFYVLLTLVQWNNTPNIAHCVVWLITLAAEVIVLATSAVSALGWHHVGRHVKVGANPVHDHVGFAGPDKWERIDLVTALIRTILLVSLNFLYVSIVARRYSRERHLLAEEGRKNDADEHTPLLSGQQARYSTQSHPRSSSDPPRATINGGIDPGSGQKDEEAAFYRPTKVGHKTWWEYCRGYAVFFPYLWPSKSLRLQFLVLLCVLLVVWMRVVNVMVPMQMGKLVSMLSDTVVEGKELEWTPLFLFMLYKTFQGNAGLVGSLRGMLWVPVAQHTYSSLTTAAFEHVHSLSLDFHLSKRTGELLSALNKGSSINGFLEQVTFNVLPMIFDLLVAIVFFYWLFGPVYALAVSVITFYYLYVSIQMARTRVDERREMVNMGREEEAVKNDSITSYETVKYFNAEPREFTRYREAIGKFQAAEAKVLYGSQSMNIAQTMVFMTGFFVIITMFAFEVSQGSRTVSEFVSMISYLNQLQGPLNFFATFYRTIQQAMIAGERLLELFKIRPSVVDRPGVKELSECTGHVRWKNVGFSYDRRKPALHDIDFDCPPGTTTAFVGESGGGKSTVFRLMFRYYNCEKGSIEIDGQDVKDLSIDSVRRFIGVVPQDTNLFNETLMFNLKYANPEATDEDVFEACRAAAIHDRIMGFPDGYNTQVGERGLRLSGGEKQRVAIARTILKKPKIIMLDEATSALDSETEQRIQAKLINGNLGQDRTLLIIAHRLSTITHADQIIVLNNGTVAEKGTHEQLLALGGRYASMWDRHCRAERAVQVARVATTKANKLLAQANISSTQDHHADDVSDGYASIASSTVLHSGGMNSPRGHNAGSSSGSDAGSDVGSHGDDDSSRAQSPFEDHADGSHSHNGHITETAPPKSQAPA